MTRYRLGVLCLFITAGCGAAPPEAASPNAPPAATGTVAEAPTPVLDTAEPIIPEPGPSCAPLAERPAAKPCPAAGSPELAAALASDNPASLLSWEACERFEPGLIRALVAELGPPECADVVVEALVSDKRQPSAELREVLAGLGIAARLARLAGEPPRLEPPYDRERFKQFLQGQLSPWIVAQAKAIDKLSSQGAALRGYAQGVVAIQAGLADLRMVEVMRAVNLPEELAGDKEFSEVYFAVLDQGLEPRKQRGRDAALVGLRRFREQGAIDDQRLSQAHRLLSTLYNGRPIDRLGTLLLPEPPSAAGGAPPGAQASYAAVVPTYYAARMLSAEELRQQVSIVAVRGLPKPLQQAVEAPGAKALPDRERLTYALALARMGQRYFARAEFERAAKVAATLERSAGDVGATAKLLSALGKAFAGAPEDAARMMLQGFGAWKPDVSALDQLGKGRGEVAGMAGFNAAFLLQLAAPPSADASYWRELGSRYGRAAGLLKGDAKARAGEFAEAALATAKAVEP